MKKPSCRPAHATPHIVRWGACVPVLLALGACAAPAGPSPSVLRAEAAVDEARAVGAVVGAPEPLYAARVALARARLLDEDGDRSAAEQEADVAARHAEDARQRTLAAGLPPRGLTR